METLRSKHSLKKNSYAAVQSNLKNVDITMVDVILT